MFSQTYLNSLKSQFSLARSKIYLNSCSKGVLCSEVSASILEFLDTWDQLGAPWELWLEKAEEGRQSFAELVNASAEEVAITSCVSAGTNAVASSLEFDRRSKVVLSKDEFPTLVHIWSAQRRRGARIQFVAPEPSETLLDAFEEEIDDSTVIVVVHQIHHATGTYLDIQRLAKICHERGAYLFLDAYHSAGVIDLDVQALDVDFLITGCMKYLLGAPGGIAFLYVRQGLIPTLEPLYTGWLSQRDTFTYSPSSSQYAVSARRFETGLQSIAGLYPSIAGIQFINGVGTAQIEEHVTSLANLFQRKLAQLGILSLTPADLDVPKPMVSVDCKDPLLAIRCLADYNIVVANWQNALRFSFHCYTSDEDIYRTASAINVCKDSFLLVPG